MRKYKKLNKKRVAKVFLYIVIIFATINFVRYQNYQKIYVKKQITIEEKYNRTTKSYQFKLTKGDKVFPFSLKSKQFFTRKIINDVEIKEKDSTICIIPKSKKIETYPLCYQEDSLISYHELANPDLIPEQYKKQISIEKDSYQKIDINTLNNKKYYIWNYKGFYAIDKKGKKEIPILENDTYNLTLISKVGKYIVMADYNSKYNFDTFYVINSQNNKVKEIKNKEDISFESYIAGVYKKRLYIIDKKNKKEYELNPKKGKITNIMTQKNGRILSNNEWQKISTNKLTSAEHKFTFNQVHNYELINNQLYEIEGEFKTRLSSKEIKEIVCAQDEHVYYIAEDKLYFYNPKYGETLIMSYFEWNFNYHNMIYIF